MPELLSLIDARVPSCTCGGSRYRVTTYWLFMVSVLYWPRSWLGAQGSGEGKVKTMEIQRLEVERYKVYQDANELRLRPLTILVGGNNSGKSTLSRTMPLLAGGFLVDRPDEAPMPLESFGLKYGDSFEDLITDRAVHGNVKLVVTFKEMSLSFKIQNVFSQGEPQQVIQSWAAKTSAGQSCCLERQRLDKEDYEVRSDGSSDQDQRVVEVRWLGLRPRFDGAMPWLADALGELSSWARGIRYLCSPRELIGSPFTAPTRVPATIGATGRDTPLMLASSDSLLHQVEQWYRRAFEVRLDIWRPSGGPCSLRVKSGAESPWVGIERAGQGLSQVLPVVLHCISAKDAGPGVDIVEHPEAELHPQAHSEIADLILDHLPGPQRPLIVETHSEVLLLRVRRRIAEGKIDPDQVGIFWVENEEGRYATLRQIELTPDGEVKGWPEGVFLEDYEEIIAIRRAARGRS